MSVAAKHWVCYEGADCGDSLARPSPPWMAVQSPRGWVYGVSGKAVPADGAATGIY